MKYEVVYKCPLCGRRRLNENLVETSEEVGLQIVKVENDMVICSPDSIKVPLYASCDCGARSVGLAQFIGFHAKH